MGRGHMWRFLTFKVRALVKDKRGESMMLFLLFVIWFGLMFMGMTYQMTRGVATMSHLSRLSDEVAVNVSMVGLDRLELQAGRVALDMSVTEPLIRNTLDNEGLTDYTFTVGIQDGGVVLVITWRGVSATGVARPRVIGS